MGAQPGRGAWRLRQRCYRLSLCGWTNNIRESVAPRAAGTRRALQGTHPARSMQAARDDDEQQHEDRHVTDDHPQQGEAAEDLGRAASCAAMPQTTTRGRRRETRPPNRLAARHRRATQTSRLSSRSGSSARNIAPNASVSSTRSVLVTADSGPALRRNAITSPLKPANAIPISATVCSDWGFPHDSHRGSCRRGTCPARMPWSGFLVSPPRKPARCPVMSRASSPTPKILIRFAPPHEWQLHGIETQHSGTPPSSTEPALADRDTGTCRTSTASWREPVTRSPSVCRPCRDRAAAGRGGAPCWVAFGDGHAGIVAEVSVDAFVDVVVDVPRAGASSSGRRAHTRSRASRRTAQHSRAGLPGGL